MKLQIYRHTKQRKNNETFALFNSADNNLHLIFLDLLCDVHAYSHQQMMHTQ